MREAHSRGIVGGCRKQRGMRAWGNDSFYELSEGGHSSIEGRRNVSSGGWTVGEQRGGWWLRWLESTR